MAPGQPASSPPMNSQLGTGFVPNSPEVTAQQIAGPKAQAQAEAALAQVEPGEGQPMGPGQPAKGQPMKEQAGQDQQAGQPMQPMPSATATTKSGAAKKGETAENQKLKDEELKLNNPPDADSRGEGNGQDAAAKAKFEKEPWFAKLPPSLRSAIQSKSRGKTPRGYEERLKRYFESVE